MSIDIPKLLGRNRPLIGEGPVLTPGGAEKQHIDPNTGSVIATVHLAGAGDVDLAVATGHTAQAAWASLAPGRRGQIILKWLDEPLRQIGALVVCAISVGWAPAGCCTAP